MGEINETAGGQKGRFHRIRAGGGIGVKTHSTAPSLLKTRVVVLLVDPQDLLRRGGPRFAFFDAETRGLKSLERPDGPFEAFGPLRVALTGLMSGKPGVGDDGNHARIVGRLAQTPKQILDSLSV